MFVHAIDWICPSFDNVNHNALYIKIMKLFISVSLLSLTISIFSFLVVLFVLNGIICFQVFLESCMNWFCSLTDSIYTLDDICDSTRQFQGCYIIIYADDVLLISPSVLTLEHLLHAC